MTGPARLSGFLLLALAAAQPALAQTVVPVRAIRAMSTITAGDVELSEAEIPGAVVTLAEVIGREARVTLYTGRPILTAQIGAPALVERNQPVRMNFRQGPLSITADGRVLDRGGSGETVRVMNLTSRQIVSGTVGEDGSIEVGK